MRIKVGEAEEKREKGGEEQKRSKRRKHVRTLGQF